MQKTSTATHAASNLYKVHYLMTALHRTKCAGKLVLTRYVVSSKTLTSDNIREKQVDSEYHLHKIFPSIYLYKPVEGIDSKFFVITRENKHAEKILTHHLSAIFS